ncbi:MAG: Mrp/NBP35 family ATP-binding protein [Armatimonadota bacterium]
MNDAVTPEQISAAREVNKISHVIGVMSGKGGVGKSLVSALLATALANSENRVGILDADITGPSIPRMFGVDVRPDVCDIGIFPAETGSGIKLISINLFLQNSDDAVIWRGPLISNTIKQFWNDVFWGELDYLVVDLPPGTADAPITVVQSLPLTCVVIVTSPQDLAAMVVRKAVNMCRKMKVPILGLVQNMAYLECPSCEERIYPFGKANGEELAETMGVPYLLDIPIDRDISKLADTGMIEEYKANPFVDKYAEISNAIKTAQGMRGVRICDEDHSGR